MTGVRWPSPPLPINTRGGGAEKGKGGKPKQKGISGEKKRERRGAKTEGPKTKKEELERFFLKEKGRRNRERDRQFFKEEKRDRFFLERKE
jgi:hypothetical protein